MLIASPEYNFSVTPALKNAIDWASRPPDQAWQDKPIAIFSCTGGPVGGARVQYDLRKILTQLWGHVLPRPEVFIGNSASKFDAEGRLTDETTTQVPHRSARRVQGLDRADGAPLIGYTGHESSDWHSPPASLR